MLLKSFLHIFCQVCQAMLQSSSHQAVLQSTLLQSVACPLQRLPQIIEWHSRRNSKHRGLIITIVSLLGQFDNKSRTTSWCQRSLYSSQRRWCSRAQQSCRSFSYQMDDAKIRRILLHRGCIWIPQEASKTTKKDRRRPQAVAILVSNHLAVRW